MERDTKSFSPSDILGGTLNILGLKLDLGELLSSPETLAGELEALRERLKEAGGKKSLSDEEWKAAGVAVGGYIRTRGILGDQEYHIGTTGRRAPPAEPAPSASEPSEPPVDVFEEEGLVTIVADVPGVSLNDLDIKLAGNMVSISTKGKVRRSYRKDVTLQGPVLPETLKATCHNGVLEIRIQKKVG